MRLSDHDILIIPGLGGSGPDHWQTRWEKGLSTARRIEQDDWENPQRSVWSPRIHAAIAQSERPVLILAHSLGNWALAHAAQGLPPGRIRGALLVAPPDEAKIGEVPAIGRDFLPGPRERLPFPSLLVASRDDPWMDYATAENLAAAWGSQLIDAGASGHINADSGHGPWPEGLMLLAGFLKKL